MLDMANQYSIVPENNGCSHMKSVLVIEIHQNISTPKEPNYNLVLVNKHPTIANKPYLGGCIVLAEKS